MSVPKHDTDTVTEHRSDSGLQFYDLFIQLQIGCSDSDSLPLGRNIQRTELLNRPSRPVIHPDGLVGDIHIAGQQRIRSAGKCPLVSLLTDYRTFFQGQVVEVTVFNADSIPRPSYAPFDIYIIDSEFNFPSAVWIRIIEHMHIPDTGVSNTRHPETAETVPAEIIIAVDTRSHQQFIDKDMVPLHESRIHGHSFYPELVHDKNRHCEHKKHHRTGYRQYPPDKSTSHLTEPITATSAGSPE